MALRGGHTQRFAVPFFLMLLVPIIGSVVPCDGAVFNVSTEPQLRSALYDAQSNSQHDVVNVLPGVYAVGSQLPFDSSEAYSLTIQGSGTDSVIDGGGGTRLLWLWSRANNSNAWILLSNLVFTNGYVNNEDIAGIHVRTQRGDLTVRDCTFAKCTAASLFEEPNTGGLYARVENTGRVLIERNRFINNSAKGLMSQTLGRPSQDAPCVRITAANPLRNSVRLSGTAVVLPGFPITSTVWDAGPASPAPSSAPRTGPRMSRFAETRTA